MTEITREAVEELLAELREASTDMQRTAWMRRDGGQELSLSSILADKAADTLAVSEARCRELEEALREADAAVNASYSQALAENQDHDIRAAKYDNIVREWRRKARAVLSLPARPAQEASRPEPVADHKWLDPECGVHGCQSLVWKARYESAVHGRREFRQAYKDARVQASVKDCACADFIREWPSSDNAEVNETLNAVEKALRAPERKLGNDAVRRALDQLVEEKCDYMRINNLDDPETQHTIKAARAVGCTAGRRALSGDT